MLRLRPDLDAAFNNSKNLVHNGFMDDEEKEPGLAVRASRQQIAVVAAFFLGLFVLALGAGLYFFRSNSTSGDIKIISGALPSSAQAQAIVVDVGGAVNSPGLYKLPGDARVADAVSAAGGLSADADSKQVNLAAKVSDGQKVYVPDKFQIPNSKLQNGEVAGVATNSLVSINNATVAELDTLPGIGPATASKIIASRPYSSLNDLVLKKAVSSSVFEKIKDKITY